MGATLGLVAADALRCTPAPDRTAEFDEEAVDVPPTLLVVFPELGALTAEVIDVGPLLPLLVPAGLVGVDGVGLLAAIDIVALGPPLPGVTPDPLLPRLPIAPLLLELVTGPAFSALPVKSLLAGWVLLAELACETLTDSLTPPFPANPPAVTLLMAELGPEVSLPAVAGEAVLRRTAPNGPRTDTPAGLSAKLNDLDTGVLEAETGVDLFVKPPAPKTVFAGLVPSELFTEPAAAGLLSEMVAADSCSADLLSNPVDVDDVAGLAVTEERVVVPGLLTKDTVSLVAASPVTTLLLLSPPEDKPVLPPNGFMGLFSTLSSAEPLLLILLLGLGVGLGVGLLVELKGEGFGVLMVMFCEGLEEVEVLLGVETEGLEEREPLA